MAETLLNQIINSELNSAEFFEWLTQLDYQDSKFITLSTKYNCSPSDFVTFFLNFLHEEIANCINEKREFEETKNSSEINRSHSFPLDLSSELEDNVSNSTPKITKVNSDSNVLNYMSPISPIYKHSSFSTPKGPQSVCLGDFIISRKLSSKKKDSKRRIKPTDLNQSKNSFSSFHNSENSFNFNKSEPEFPSERSSLVEEKLRILSRSNVSVNLSPKKPVVNSEVQPELCLVNNKKQIDEVVRIYVELLNKSFVLNLTSEIHFLISLLLKKQLYNLDWGISILTDFVTVTNLFNTVHNIVYFASKCLEKLVRILRNYDNSTIRLLVENERVSEFSPELVKELQKVTKPDRVISIENSQENICFNSDTDNRQNFPNDLSFHAFRKQRDLFYEILRIWELHHLSPNFNFVLSLRGKIKTLLSLSSEATNFIHFSRLFKAQLLNTNRNSDDFLTSLDVDAQKLSKLNSRCVTKGNSQGLNSLPIFTEVEEFYKEFILVASNYSFNRHLCDTFIEEITELNESYFGNSEEEDHVDFVTKKSYYTCIKNLRTCAKFLGYIESLPYKSDVLCYSNHLMTTHFKIRQQIRPNFDVKTLLDNSIRRKSVVLCIPWIVKYLSMLDNITLKLPYYIQIQTSLYWIYRNFNWGPDPNIYLIKFSLGWLFELSHLPDNNFLYFSTQSHFNTKTPKFCLDTLEIVDQDILYFCCPYLEEIKKLLTAPTTTNHSVSIKHITPVTTPQAPDEIARKKREQQLEEAFFNGQPISIRKTVEFVSERVASTCVKYVCQTLVPAHKKAASEKFKNSIQIKDEDVETQKAALKTKANQLAVTSLNDLQIACHKEIKAICNSKVEKAIEALVSLDILPQTKNVCVGITKKSCLERVKQWVDSHVNLSVFIKDFNDEIQKITTSESNKKAKRPVFMLPCGGNRKNHNDNTTSAAHLLEQYQSLTIKVIEKNEITKDCVLALLIQTTESISQRGDFNECILASICTQLLDLVLLLLAYDSQLVTSDVLSQCCDIWRLYYNGCDDLFKFLLCPRNVTIFTQSKNPKATWDAFAKFCAFLIQNSFLKCDVFESQCTGIFRIDWDQNTLKLISDFLKTCGGLYRDQSGDTCNFLLDFFSDYCEDLF